MVISYEEKEIIKYLQIKYKHDGTRIVNDHPEYGWDVNNVKQTVEND